MGSMRALTEYAVERTHEDVVLSGDAGGKQRGGVWNISHLKGKRMHTTNYLRTWLKLFEPLTESTWWTEAVNLKKIQKLQFGK